jgi:DNA topoisomerase 2-associated protein PAT1
LSLEDLLVSQFSNQQFFSLSLQQNQQNLQREQSQQILNILLQIEDCLLENQLKNAFDNEIRQKLTNQLNTVQQLKTFLHKFEQNQYNDQSQLDNIYQMKKQLRDLLVNSQQQQYQHLQEQLQRQQQIQNQLRQQQKLQQKLQQEVEQQQRLQSQKLQDANNNFPFFFYTLEELDNEVLDEKFTLVQKQEQCQLRKQLESLEKAKQQLEVRLNQADKKVSQYMRQIQQQQPEQQTLLTIVTRQEQPNQQQRSQSCTSCSMKQEANELFLNGHFSN